MHGQPDPLLAAMDAFAGLKPIISDQKSIGWSAADGSDGADPLDSGQPSASTALHNMAQYALAPVLLEPPTNQRFILIAAPDHARAAAYLVEHRLRPVKVLTSRVLLAERSSR